MHQNSQPTKHLQQLTQAIQVCDLFENEMIKQREINGLMEAMLAYNLIEGLILTTDTEEILHVGAHLIQILPTWKWLL